MTAVTPDRRILKAFYTQYVAVLLILLVFVVSGFQRHPEQAPANPKHYGPKRQAPIGAISINMPEKAHEALSTELAAKLSAVAEFVRNHDIRATFRIPIAAQHESDADATQMLRQSIARAAQLRGYMVELGVPARAITTVLVDGEESSSSTSVTFSTMEEADEQR